MRGIRRHQRGWAWLAVVLLLSHAAAAGGGKFPAQTDAVLGPIVICTSDGAKIVLGHAGNDRPGSCAHCLACAPAAQTGLADFGNDAVPILFPAPSAPHPAGTNLDPLALHLSRGGIYSRGPPRAT